VSAWVALAAAALWASQTGPTPTISRGCDTASEAARTARFLQLLRTYPERPIAESFAAVSQLLEAGPFPERDRAEYWLGSARQASGDREGARAAFDRLAHDHPGSPWVERSWLSLGDAAAQERRYGAALEWLQRAGSAGDPGVRELARISAGQILILRARQRWAWASAAAALGVGLAFLIDWLRRKPRQLFPLPAELRIVLPVLAVFAVLSTATDPAPRRTALALCAGGALLIGLSGLRQRAAGPRGLALAVHLLAALLALCALAYAAVWQWDLFGMVLETFRTGPE